MFEKLRKLFFSPDPKRNTRFEVTLHIEGQGADGKFLAAADDEYVIGVEPAGSILFDPHTLKVRSPIVKQRADLVFISRDGFNKDGVFTIRVDKCGGNAEDRTEAEVRVSSIALAIDPASDTSTTETSAELPDSTAPAASSSVATPASSVAAAATIPTPSIKPTVTPPPIVPTIKKKSRIGRWMMSAAMLTIVGGTAAYLITRDNGKKPVAVVTQSKPQNTASATPLDPPDTASAKPSVTNEDATTQVAPIPAPSPAPAPAPTPVVVAPAPVVAPQPAAIDPIPNPTTQPPAKYVRIHY